MVERVLPALGKLRAPRVQPGEPLVATGERGGSGWRRALRAPARGWRIALFVIFRKYLVHLTRDQVGRVDKFDIYGRVTEERGGLE